MKKAISALSTVWGREGNVQLWEFIVFLFLYSADQKWRLLDYDHE